MINIDERDGVGKTALMTACYYGKIKVARMLIDFGANIHLKNKQLRTPLMLCCMTEEDESAETGRLSLAKKLIEKGADVNIVDSRNHSILDWAEIYHFNRIAELLRKHGAKNWNLMEQNKSKDLNEQDF
jgi:ankyrin repeat protein